MSRTVSKLLSLALRHEPSALGLAVDAGGWADVSELLDGLRAHGHDLAVADLRSIVTGSDKQRFAISDDGIRIRANQGHSIAVDLGLQPVIPPSVLFHGTGAQNVASILRIGLESRGRNHVHLSGDEDTARKVGMRHGKPVVLAIRAAQMHENGTVFYRSANGVWLVESVPPEYISA